MFGPVTATPYDLQFHISGIPVRVHPGFWIFGALLGWTPGVARLLEHNILAVVLVWLACLFLSILVHELGHALVARAFGWPPAIMLYHFGGLAMYSPGSRHTPMRSIAISIAGPGAGFILFGIVYVIDVALIANGNPPRGFAWWAIASLKFVNLWWGLLNLLPVLPLDGGRICESALEVMRLRNHQEIALKIAVGAGACAAFLLWRLGLVFAGLMFVYLAVQNYQALQHRRRGGW